MKTAKQQYRMNPDYQIGIGVLLSVLTLIAIDKDTKGWSDLLNPSNIVAFFIYGVPTFIICCLLYRVLAKKRTVKKSITLSLVVGVPVSFAFIIATFLFILS